VIALSSRSNFPKIPQQNSPFHGMITSVNHLKSKETVIWKEEPGLHDAHTMTCHKLWQVMVCASFISLWHPTSTSATCTARWKKTVGNKLLRSWDRGKTRMISGYMSVALIDSYEIHLGFILLDCLQTSSSAYWIYN
jgi:hypothetical protein